MSLTRSQLLAGDSSQGNVLPGQVQGVKQGNGVFIAPDGTISFDATAEIGVVKTNNSSAYNGYKWPGSKTIDAFLYQTDGPANELGWVKRGMGLTVQNALTQPTVKLSIPTTNTEPSAGSEVNEAVTGSLYWNTDSSNLFVYVNDGWVQATYGPANLNEALLTGSYTLYVNPEIGSDIYVTGDFSPPGDLPVITNQQVTAGYSAQKPFKTIERAALEIARIQKGLGQDSEVFDRYVIKCSTGVHIVGNGLGSASPAEWANGSTPSAATLQEMNSAGYAGIILPRGVSIIGEDLRKTVIRPSYVPAKTGNIEADRGAIFRITGGAFFFNFTFKDKTGLNASHHLLDCFSFVSDADLQTYYSKVETVFAQDYPNTIVNPGETEIVATKPASDPDETTDDVFGSSPYVFNCSVRSKYGMCGINADGSGVTGFKSLVTAQFTGVSLQRDLYCWQRYSAGSNEWVPVTSYTSYVITDPDDLRMNPDRKSFHIRAINGAFIQEVSVFAIGQGVHHWSTSGGEISITNSNSSFGGCAALAEGYKSESFPQDMSWNVGRIVLGTNLSDQSHNILKIQIGTVDSGVANDATSIVLTDNLVESEIYAGIPEILASRGYTFAEDSYLWIENSSGADWRAQLPSAAWVPSSPDTITIAAVMENQNGDFPGDPGQGDLAGSKVYIRRLIDSRTVSQRRYSLEITNTDSTTRTPPRDFVLQTALGSGGGIQDLIPDSQLTIVNKSGAIPIGLDPVVRKSQVVLQAANSVKIWTANSYYRAGETVRRNNKHYTCVVTNSDDAFNSEKWNESYVHMPSVYNAYDYFQNVTPVIIFDNDTDDEETTPASTCGYDLTTCWTLDVKIRSQLMSATDYQGVYQFLVGLGFSGAEAEDILTPVVTANRKLNPASSVAMKGYVPNGAANALANWPIEFRRPSIVRMFGHAWEWAGYLNYTKALPSYQKELSAQNQFTYFFTNQLGGRVYATGYNQEGYLVTAAGLTDLATGDTINLSNIGNPFFGVDIPTYFPALTVGDLTVETSLEFNDGCELSGSPFFSDEWYNNFRLATSTVPGLITLSDIPSPTSEFPSGTKLAFNQASAPPGWTQLTSTSLNDASMRIVTGSGGGSGGSTGFTSVFTGSRSSSISLSSGGSVGGHILSVSQMPSHRHILTFRIKENDTAAGGGDDGVVVDTPYEYTGYEGGDAIHGHTFTNPSYTMSSMDFAVKYVDFIIAQKS